jgi:hypothetical protein
MMIFMVTTVASGKNSCGRSASSSETSPNLEELSSYRQDFRHRSFGNNTPISVGSSISICLSWSFSACIAIPYSRRARLYW